MEFEMESFLGELERRKQYIDQALEERLGGDMAFPPVIHQAMHYAVMNGGKRLRPIMTLEAGSIAGCPSHLVLPAACALEMIHSYSLVHDDLPAMDDDDFRRGLPTCHKVFGEANAILTGDALLTGAFEVLASIARLEGVNPCDVLTVITEIARAAGSQGMIGGQVLDLAGEIKGETELSRLHALKTGELFKVALRTGAILGAMPTAGLQNLTDFGTHFGLAFQITDDILDVCGDQELIGKPVGSDERNVRTTYTSIYGLDGATAKARESVEACLACLARFGPEADFLRALARFTLYRRS